MNSSAAVALDGLMGKIQTHKIIKFEEAPRQMDQEKIDREWRALAGLEYSKPIDEKRRPEGIIQASIDAVLNWPLNEFRGLWICGDSGRWKSRLLYKSMKRFLEFGKTVTAIDGNDFSTLAQHAAREAEDMNFVTSMKKPSLLYIDDFGKRSLTESAAYALHDVIEKRYKWGKQTWVSTNLDANEIRARLTKQQPNQIKPSPDASHLAESLIRRIREYFKVIKL